AAQRTLVPELVGEDEHAVGKANTFLQSAQRVTMLLGPAVAGVLIAWLGAPSVLVIDAATYVVSFVLVGTFVRVARRAVAPQQRAQPRGGARVRPGSASLGARLPRPGGSDRRRDFRLRVLQRRRQPGDPYAAHSQLPGCDPGARDAGPQRGDDALDPARARFR